MKKKSLTFLFAWIVLSGLSMAAAPVHEKESDPSNLAFSVCDHHHEQELLNSQKEDLTSQFSQQKIKFLAFGFFQSGILDYAEFRFFHQTLSTHTFILGHATALRAPPLTSLF